MNNEEAIKYGIEWLEDEYLDAGDRAFIELALEALKQMPVITTTGGERVIYYPQVEGVTPTVIDVGKQEPFDEYGNYKYPSDFELTEPNTATSMPCGDVVDRNNVCAFIAGLISDDREREKGLEYIRNMPSVNPQTCNDAISRQAVLDMATTIQTDDYSGNEIIEVVDVDDVKALPPVTPQPKTGHWKAKSFHELFCDNCGFDFDIMKNDFIDKMNYCPNCGAKMVEPQGSERTL